MKATRLTFGLLLSLTGCSDIIGFGDLQPGGAGGEGGSAGEGGEGGSGAIGGAGAGGATGGGGAGAGGLTGGGGMGGEGGGLLELGDACSDNDECISTQCVDGVCCNTLCEAECFSCALAGLEGTCSQLPVGSNDDGECAAGVCNASSTCVVEDVLWAIGGNAAGTRARAMDAGFDSQGNLWVGGSFIGSMQLDGCTTINSDGGSQDAWLGKLNPAGECTFLQAFGNDFGEEITDLAVDPATDAVVVTGYYTGSINFGGPALPPATNEDVFVAKLTSDGTLVSATVAGSAGFDRGISVDVAPDGSVVVAGNFAGTWSWPNEGAVPYAGDTDMFVAKLDGADLENDLWVHAYGDAGAQGAFEVAVDSMGNVILSGNVKLGSSVDYGCIGGALTGLGAANDITIAKLNGSNGSCVFNRIFGGMTGSFKAVPGIGFDASDHVVIAGAFQSELVGPVPPYTGTGNSDLFVAKLDAADGTFIWDRQYDTGGLEEIFEAAVDDNGDVFVTGRFGSTNLAFEPAMPITTMGNDDVFIAKLDGSNGDGLWAKGFGDASDGQRGQTVAVNAFGAVAVAGWHVGTLNFSSPLTPTVEDAFVALLAP